jgi:hypothetical protein
VKEKIAEGFYLYMGLLHRIAGYRENLGHGVRCGTRENLAMDGPCMWVDRWRALKT